MEINATFMEERKVSVSPSDIKRAFNNSTDITSKHALKALKIKLMLSFGVRQWWLEDNHWRYTKNSGGHGHYDYDTEVKGRMATTTEKFVYSSIQSIEKEILDLKL